MSRTEDRRQRDRIRALLDQHPWITRQTELRFRRQEATIGLSTDLFSSAGVDVGTERLLRLLAREDSPLMQDDTRRVLDLGCGVGAIGIALAIGTGRDDLRVWMTDRDRLAVSVAGWNARHNGLTAGDAPPIASVAAGVGYAALDHDVARFDLIVTNIPAKVGRAGLDHLLFGAGHRLRAGGAVAFVHVAPLTDTIDAVLQARVDAGLAVEIGRQSVGKEHVARVWRLPDGLPDPQGDAITPYLREDAPERLLLRNMPVMTHVAVHDVDEFDTPHFRTPLLVDLLQTFRPIDQLERAERTLVVDPCHGFLPAMLAERRESAEIALLSRDTLEEAVAERNLSQFLSRRGSAARRVDAPVRPDHPWLPAPAGDAGFDCVVGPVRMREGKRGVAATLTAWRDALRDDGRAYLALSVPSGQVESLRHIAGGVGLRVGRTRSRKGHTALILRPHGRSDEVTP